MDLLDALLAHRDPRAGRQIDDDGPIAPGDPAAPPRKPVRTWQACQLEEHELEATRNEAEDERHGILDGDYECKMCKFAYSDGDENIAEHLKAVFTVYKKMDSYPKNVRYDAMAKKWNSTLYEMDSRLGHRLGVEQLTRADVRYHMRRHYKPSDLERLDDLQTYVYQNMQAIEEDGLFQKLYIDGVEQNTREISSSATTAWCKLSNQYQKLGKLKLAARLQEYKAKNPNSMNTGQFIMNRIRKETQL